MLLVARREEDTRRDVLGAARRRQNAQWMERDRVDKAILISEERQPEAPQPQPQPLTSLHLSVSDSISASVRVEFRLRLTSVQSSKCLLISLFLVLSNIEIENGSRMQSAREKLVSSGSGNGSGTSALEDTRRGDCEDERHGSRVYS